MSGADVFLRGVDRAAFAVGLAGRLRRAGVPCGLTDVDDFVRALGACPPHSRDRLYWTARVSLVRRQADLAAFERVFAGVFDDAPAVAERRGPAPRGESFVSLPADHGAPDSGGLPWATLPPVVADADGPAGERGTPDRRPSALAGLADRPFEELDAAQVALLGERLRAAAWPTRRTRRQRTGAAGRRIALRPTLTRARRTGWEPVALVRSRPVRRPRRVVLLCDVSQSMQAQAAAYLHLMRAFAAVADAEVFAFATTLTRLTAVLRHTSAPAAVARAGDLVTDRFGGTRIATNLRALLASHHGNAVRGAVVVIGSDGWDSDPPAELAAVLARLRRRAYRIIWMNPRAGAPGFAPRVGSMAAALPFCDRLLPAGTFRDLDRVAEQIADGATAPVSSRGSHGSTAGSGRR
ncbi:VWA domain-containing protein [Actinoplanes sp. NPDC049668]|uniref:vWA domain-containing protein n=1 Tax=unclassified Actinoplanes TaxID=2626549 RepID=UPI00339E9D93